MMVLIGGGLVSFWGPVIGVAVFLLARDLIGGWTTGWMLWFGLLFVAMILFRPEGVAGIIEDARARWLRLRGRAATTLARSMP